MKGIPALGIFFQMSEGAMFSPSASSSPCRTQTKKRPAMSGLRPQLSNKLEAALDLGGTQGAG